MCIFLRGSNKATTLPHKGPKAHGSHWTLHVMTFSKNCLMVWDLSRSVPGVFRSPGSPLIKLFHLLFNSKCRFFKVHFLYNCLLNCLLYCPCYSLVESIGPVIPSPLAQGVPAPAPWPSPGLGPGTTTAQWHNRQSNRQSNIN